MQSECSEMQDEVKLVLDKQGVYSEIFVRRFLPRIDARLENILNANQNWIITEGKTDWKHLKNALIQLQQDSTYTDLDINFVEYEDNVQMGSKPLEAVCSYNALFYSEHLKIFVFDADDPQINKKHEGQLYLKRGNNVYSMVLPVPEHRKDTTVV